MVSGSGIAPPHTSQVQPRHRGPRAQGEGNSTGEKGPSQGHTRLRTGRKPAGRFPAVLQQSTQLASPVSSPKGPASWGNVLDIITVPCLGQGP